MKKSKNKLIIIGGTGNGTVITSAVEDYIDEIGGWEIMGYLNDFEKKGRFLNGFPVLGTTEEIKRYDKKDCYFIYSLLSAQKSFERKKKLEGLHIEDKKFATFVHPKASVSRHSRLGRGVMVMPNAVISPNVTVGNHTHIYANSLVGHDTTIGNFCFIANSASVGSRVIIDEGVHIGSNSSILESVHMGVWSMVGLGAVVIKDVEPYAKVVGNPAKPIGRVNV